MVLHPDGKIRYFHQRGYALLMDRTLSHTTLVRSEVYLALLLRTLPAPLVAVLADWLPAIELSNTLKALFARQVPQTNHQTIPHVVSSLTVREVARSRSQPLPRAQT